MNLIVLMITQVMASPVTDMDYRMVSVPSGTYFMGSPPTEKGRFNDETRLEVKLTRAFSMGRTEVTQGLWTKVMKSNPSASPACGPKCPVDSVNWCDAVAFSNILSEQEGLPLVYTLPAGFEVGMSNSKCNAFSVLVSMDRSLSGYRLPTEAEWEYAARGGNSEWPYAGGDVADLVGWHSFNSGKQSHRVCQKKANTFGFCDMSGNVSEWVWDGYDSLSQGRVVNPMGSKNGATKVVRGGSCRNEIRYLRVSNRGGFYPEQHYDSLGFRLVRTSGF